MEGYSTQFVCLSVCVGLGYKRLMGGGKKEKGEERGEKRWEKRKKRKERRKRGKNRKERK